MSAASPGADALKLLPCPFCGKEGDVKFHLGSYSYHVECCDWACPSKSSGPRDRVIAAWNTRASDAELAALREENEFWRNRALSTQAALKAIVNDPALDGLSEDSLECARQALAGGGNG